MKWRKWFSGIFLIGFYFSMANPLWAVTFDGVHYLIPPGLVNGYSAGKVPAELVLIQGKEVAGTMHPVVTIGNGAFSNCTTLEHVVIPETIQRIDNSAFRKCSSLKSVVFAHKDSIPSLGVAIFYGCDQLEKIIVETASMAEILQPKINVLPNPPQIVILGAEDKEDGDSEVENETEKDSEDLIEDGIEDEKEDASDESQTGSGEDTTIEEPDGENSEGSEKEESGEREESDQDNVQEENGMNEENEKEENDSGDLDQDSGEEVDDEDSQEDHQEENMEKPEKETDTGNDNQIDAENEQTESKENQDQSADDESFDQDDVSKDDIENGNQGGEATDDPNNDDTWKEDIEKEEDAIIMDGNILKEEDDAKAYTLTIVEMAAQRRQIQEKYTAGNGGKLVFEQEKVTAKADEGYVFWQWSDGKTYCQRDILIEGAPVIAQFVQADQIPYDAENASAQPLVWSAVRMQKWYIQEDDKRAVAFRASEAADLFPDIIGQSRQQALQFVIDRQLFQGTEQRLILPEAPMTKAMCAVVAQKLIGNRKSLEETDLNWYHESWQQGKANGILPESWTNPQETVTAAEFADLLRLAAAHKGILGPKLSYTDSAINRAEAAAMLQQYIVLAVSRNDSSETPYAYK